MNKKIEGEEEKTESMNINSDKEGDNMNQTSAPHEPATTPQTTAPILKQDHEINRLIDDLTKLDDDDEKVSINLLKQKQRYKYAARKSTLSN
ncbi:hypothetical protein J1N35_022544 [Gossypium stocksii]|uniref:Uncharacterized protein n=1 Tax=Gossypium stocksii TaxID=47602 RepID=A0A9D3VGV0_9ROSI|nr:hypothetical protein J1N35_022544 [Gossypium stocksii]